MASLILNFQELYNEVSRFLGTYGSSGPGTADLADAKRIVNSAYRRFLTANPNTWSFLKYYDQIITVSGQWIYELPEDFGHILGIFQYGSNTSYGPLEERSVDNIMSMRSLNTYNNYGEYFAIRPGHYTKEMGQRQEVIFYPTFNAAYTLHYCYKILTTKLENDNDVPIGGADISECLKAFCLAEAESSQDESIGTQENKLGQQLALAIANDNKKKTKTRGPMLSGLGLTPREIHRGSYRINNVTVETSY